MADVAKNLIPDGAEKTEEAINTVSLDYSRLLGQVVYVTMWDSLKSFGIVTHPLLLGTICSK